MEVKRKGAKRCNSLFGLVFAAAALPNLLVAGAIAQDEPKYPEPYSRGYYERLDYYSSIYPGEIYRFCYLRFSRDIRRIRSCLRKQQKARDAIFVNAQRQLGKQSRARAVYDECLGYHPDNGIVRVGACVETRLMLHDRVGDDATERIIYRKCELKWRHSLASTIDSCCAHEGRYYRENGRLRD